MYHRSNLSYLNSYKKTLIKLHYCFDYLKTSYLLNVHSFNVKESHHFLQIDYKIG